MSCADLTTKLTELRRRSVLYPAWAALARCQQPGGRTFWRMPNGGYALYRGLTGGTIDMDSPVGVAAPGSAIAEQLAGRPVTDGDLYYALRAFGPLGIEDDATSPTTTQVTLVAGVVQLPLPLPPGVWEANPLSGGRIEVVVPVNNVGAVVPVAELRVYSGDPAPSYITPQATIPVRAGFGIYTAAFDPQLAHGTVAGVGVRAVSALGAEEQNTVARSVTIDSQAPAQLAGVTLEAACE